MPNKYAYLWTSAVRGHERQQREFASAHLNNDLIEPPRTRPDTTIRLNGTRVGSYQRALDVAVGMYPLAVQFTDAKGRVRKIVSCDNEHQLREAIPFYFFGGHAVLRAR